jgi:hypothetical protein
MPSDWKLIFERRGERTNDVGKQCAQLKVDAKAWRSELFFFVIGAGWKVERQQS